MSSAGGTPPTALSGRSGPRSKSGCWTCRERKVKCDETKPVCGRCIKAQRQCDYAPREVQRPQHRSIAKPVLLPKVLSAAAIASKSPKNGFGQHIDQDLAAEGSPSGSTSSPASDQSSTNQSSALPVSITEQIPPQPSSSSGFITPTDSSSQERLASYDKRILSTFESKFIASLQTKTPKWSFISGIMHLCRDDQILMHMILAVVGQQVSTWEGLKHEQLLAVEHYRRGLADFARLVGSGKYERHTLVIALWLVTQYEMRFAEKGRDICRHLEGFNLAIVSHGSDLLPGLSEHPVESPSTATFRLPSTTYQDVVNRLGLWIAYHDSQASTFDLGGTIMHTLSYRWPGSIDRVFAGSRHALHDIWGDEYPANEYEDDQNNRVAFNLFHCGYVLRYKVTEFRRSMRVREGFQDRVVQLHHEIISVSEEYASLISLASSWPQKGVQPSRLTLNCRFIVSFFHAVELDFYRHAYWNEQLTTPATVALSRIMNIATIVHETEGQSSLSRHTWPLWMAGIETRDYVYQNWVVERMTDLSTSGTNILRATALLKAIIEKQRQDPQRVDYLDWLRQGLFEEFVI